MKMLPESAGSTVTLSLIMNRSPPGIKQDMIQVAVVEDVASRAEVDWNGVEGSCMQSEGKHADDTSMTRTQF